MKFKKKKKKPKGGEVGEQFILQHIQWSQFVSIHDSLQRPSAWWLLWWASHLLHMEVCNRFADSKTGVLPHVTLRATLIAHVGKFASYKALKLLGPWGNHS